MVARAPKNDNTRRVRWRPGDLRHTVGTVEGCYIPVLTWFPDERCTGPDRHLTQRVSNGVVRLAGRYPAHTCSANTSARRVARAAESARLESV